MQTHSISSSSITNFISLIPSAHYACLSARCFELKCRYTHSHTRTHTYTLSDLLASFSNFIFNWLSTRTRSQCWLTNSNWAYETAKEKQRKKESPHKSLPHTCIQRHTHTKRERYKRQLNPFLSFCSLLYLSYLFYLKHWNVCVLQHSPFA